MNEPNVIDDVRAAKSWLDSQASDMQGLSERLQVLEINYQARTGEFASVPRERPQWVLRLIEAAKEEPGRDLLGDVRSTKSI